jgi:hypothetical protein
VSLQPPALAYSQDSLGSGSQRGQLEAEAAHIASRPQLDSGCGQGSFFPPEEKKHGGEGLELLGDLRHGDPRELWASEGGVQFLGLF